MSEAPIVGFYNSLISGLFQLGNILTILVAFFAALWYPVIKPSGKGSVFMIYLDYAASAHPYPEALSAMAAVAAESFGNPGAIHGAGARARQILQESRKTLAQMLKVRPEEVYFTSGGTEANNWALRLGCVPGKNHIVASAAEHKSVLEPLGQMQAEGLELWGAVGGAGVSYTR